MKRVCYIFPVSHHYRLPFHDKLREILAVQNIDYRVFYSEPGEENLKKRDTVDIPWGFKVKITRFPKNIVYQHALRKAKSYDLIVVQQENKLAINYIFNIASMLGICKVAYFGHGRNFQARNANSIGEQWKRFWASKVNWWFAYTDQTKKYVESIGFPAKQITVFNNSVDISTLRSVSSSVTDDILGVLRRDLDLSGQNVGIFVGGIYPDKRMSFLVAAADEIRAHVPDFELIIVGGGSDLPLIENLAKNRSWIHVMGPRFGREKVELMMLGHVFMMPGLVGLAILDAGVVGLPTATTAFPWHSPEIAYLAPDENGLLVEEWESSSAYAEAVAKLLLDPSRRKAMSSAARAMAEKFSIEAMAENFAAGVLSALSA